MQPSGYGGAGRAQVAWLLAVVTQLLGLWHLAVLGVVTGLTAVVALHLSALIAVASHVTGAAAVLVKLASGWRQKVDLLHSRFVRPVVGHRNHLGSRHHRCSHRHCRWRCSHCYRSDESDLRMNVRGLTGQGDHDRRTCSTHGCRTGCHLGTTRHSHHGCWIDHRRVPRCSLWQCDPLDRL